MRLNAPKQIVFYLSVLLVVIGMIFYFIGFLQPFAIIVVLAGYVLLFLGNVLKGF